jgi:carboxylesterase type B
LVGCVRFLLLALLSQATPILDKDAFKPVNVGYATHIPTSVNSTASGLKLGLYNNIRFAQPPLGNLRFRNPQTPPAKVDGVQDGSGFQTTDCVSAVPADAPFPGVNGTTFGTEDCLFLNVWVPEGTKKGDNVPVLHWLYGSAYAFGSKDWSGSGMGIYDVLKNPEEKFIYVSSNYR